MNACKSDRKIKRKWTTTKSQHPRDKTLHYNVSHSKICDKSFTDFFHLLHFSLLCFVFPIFPSPGILVNNIYYYLPRCCCCCSQDDNLSWSWTNFCYIFRDYASVSTAIRFYRIWHDFIFLVFIMSLYHICKKTKTWMLPFHRTKYKSK